MALVLDTGPLLAAVDRSDPDHTACSKLIGDSTEDLVVPAPILPELDYFARTRIGPDLFEGLVVEIREGVFRVEDLAPNDYGRVLDLLRDYRDLNIGFVDAAVLAVVERLNEPKLATLDRRHFSVLRPRHVEALELLPG